LASSVRPFAISTNGNRNGSEPTFQGRSCRGTGVGDPRVLGEHRERASDPRRSPPVGRVPPPGSRFASDVDHDLKRLNHDRSKDDDHHGSEDDHHDEHVDHHHDEHVDHHHDEYVDHHHDDHHDRADRNYILVGGVHPTAGVPRLQQHRDNTSDYDGGDR
jgi:hypothetical protein